MLLKNINAFIFASLMIGVFFVVSTITPTPAVDAAVFVKPSVATTTGLVGYWSFDEASGSTVVDDAGNNDGTLSGGTRITGPKDGALRLNGSGYVDLGYQASFYGSAAARTLSMWVKPNAADGGSKILSIVGPNGQTYFQYSGSGGNFTVSADWSIPTGYIGAATKSHPADQWYQITATVDPPSGVTKIYVNGLLEGEDYRGSIEATGAPGMCRSRIGANVLAFGCFGSAGELFNGSVDELRIYNRVLSGAEIYDLYGRETRSNVTPKVRILQSGSATSSLIAHYTFDGINVSRDVIGDVSGLDNDGTRIPNVFGVDAGWTVSGITNPDPEDPDYEWMYVGDYTSYNGTYSQIGTYNGQPLYRKDGTHYLAYIANPDWDYYAWALTSIPDPTESWGTAFLLEGYGGDLPTLPNHAAWGSWYSNEANWGYTMPSLTEIVGTSGDADGSWAVMGKIGQAMTFNGVDEYVNAPLATTATNDWTMSAWINPSTLPQTAAMAVSNGSDNGIAGNGYAFGIGNGSDGTGSKLTALFGGVAFIDSGYTFPAANAWYHVVMTRVGGTTRFYVNGVQTPNTSSATPATPATHFRIGAQDGVRYFSGSIDDVRVYDKALSLAEVTDLYGKTSGNKAAINASQNSKITDGLVGLWSFNGPDVSGDTAYDRSGEDNDGTLTNGPKVAIGKIGQALQFDGVNDYVSIPDSSTLNFAGNDFSLNYWIKWDATPSGIDSIIGQSNGGGAQHKWHMIWGLGATGYTYEGTHMRFGFVDSGDTERGVSFAWVPQSGVWYHLTLTRTGSEWDFYVNGVQTGDTQVANYTVSNPSNPMQIGSDGESWNGFKGFIDEVRIYDRALSATEIEQLFKAK